MSWCSKKQHVVARSSTEAEYRALAHCAAEVTWIQSLLEELGIPQQQTQIIRRDSLSASALASTLVYHRTKHIELDAHFVRDKVFDNKLKIHYIPSSYQTTDLLTKPMSHSRFQLLRDKLGVLDHTPPLGGVVKIISYQKENRRRSCTTHPYFQEWNLILLAS